MDVMAERSYEVQVDSRARRAGLGSVLMRRMEEIGRRRGVDKVMLTCLKGESVILCWGKGRGQRD